MSFSLTLLASMMRLNKALLSSGMARPTTYIIQL
jgi:hypothetical protein